MAPTSKELGHPCTIFGSSFHSAKHKLTNIHIEFATLASTHHQFHHNFCLQISFPYEFFVFFLSVFAFHFFSNSSLISNLFNHHFTLKVRLHRSINCGKFARCKKLHSVNTKLQRSKKRWQSELFILYENIDDQTKWVFNICHAQIDASPLVEESSLEVIEPLIDSLNHDFIENSKIETTNTDTNDIKY